MYLPLNLPPGVFRNGTEYSSKGRWYDANLVRFYEGTRRPIGGWRAKSTTTLTGKGRAIIAWKDNSAVTWAAIGTHSKLYAMSRAGVLSDITPVGFTAGRADASAAGGYGAGNYGTGTYGTPRPDSSLILDASVWTLDTWGEKLIGCMADDGKMYIWSLSTGTPAVAISGAPTASALVATEERFIFALNAAGVARRVKWCDQENETVWTVLTTNQAGDFDLQTNGRLMCGKRVQGATLIFTDQDVHRATYIGGTLVYSFERLSDNCGIISRNAAASFGGQCVWMGPSGFWLYNGYVNPIPCDVQDYVFSNLNSLQISKITCRLEFAHGEVWWFYPSNATSEIDSYVVWNYRENHWNIGQIVRLAGVDSGVFAYPLMIGNDGYVYEHEVGYSYDGVSPFLETGPLELNNGDNVMFAKRLVPDEKTAGDVTATIKTKMWPNGAETSNGPYSLANPTDFILTGRQMKIRYTGARFDDWRVGSPRLDVVQGGMW